MKKTNKFLIIYISIFLIFTNISKAQNISAGIYYSVFKCSNGTAMSCGWNLQGQLANGTNTTQPTPVAVSNLTGITKISAGGTHSLFLKNNGTVWASGYNNMQQLGDGTTTNKNIPTQAVGLSGITEISAGQYHSLFVKSDGTVWACGQNNNGQLGIGTTTNSYTTVQVTGLTSIIAVSGGYSHSLFLKSDGTVWACGSNVYGELGIGGTSNANRTTPMQVAGLTNVIAIAAGKSNTCHSLFLKSDGTVWACGYNANGQLGDGTTTNRFAPVQVIGLSNITSIKAGTGHSLFLKSDGTAWACGENQYGQSGNGSITADNLTPIQASQVTGVSEIAAGNGFSLFLKNNGTVWACGKNTNGNLGNGTMTNATTPITVTALCNISVGIKENINEESILVFPNPTQNTLTIDLKLMNTSSELQIINTIGETVYNEVIQNPTTTIDISLLPTGVYFLKIKSKNYWNMKKIVKE